MERDRQDDVDDLVVEGDAPRRLGIVSAKSLNDHDLLRLHMLAGQREETFIAPGMREDVMDKKKPNLIAAADVESLVGESSVMRRIVGWMRGRLVQIHIDALPYWSVEHVHVDISVQQERVREYLMKQLMERVRRRKTVAGIRVVVPTSDTETTVRYMEQGFRDPPGLDESGALVWVSPPRIR